jgi:hypothetical protein
MKTHRHKVTGQYIPQLHFGNLSGRPNSKGTRFEIFEVGKGRRTEPMKQWEAVEIPDLEKGFTLAQFREHAKTYGLACSIGFLDTCDYMKSRIGRMMVSEAYPDDETTAWCIKTFRINPRHCYTSILGCFGHYSFDVLEFEKHLEKVFGYPSHLDMSMRDFMQKTFGEENTARFEAAFLPLTNAKESEKVALVN